MLEQGPYVVVVWYLLFCFVLFVTTTSASCYLLLYCFIYPGEPSGV